MPDFSLTSSQRRDLTDRGVNAVESLVDGGAPGDVAVELVAAVLDIVADLPEPLETMSDRAIAMVLVEIAEALRRDPVLMRRRANRKAAAAVKADAAGHHRRAGRLRRRAAELREQADRLR